MAVLSIAEIRRGKVILVDEKPYLVTENIFNKRAQRTGMMETKLKSLLTGDVISKTFRGGDMATEANVSYQRCQYLYANGDNYNFMNNTTFEQFSLPAEQLGLWAKFLLEGSDVDTMYFNNLPVGIELPAKIVLQVKESPPSVKGDTATSASKQVTLETGYVVNVPLFIKEGDKVKINTETGEYVERAN